MLQSLKLIKRKKKIVYSLYYASSSTYDQPLFKLKFYMIKFIHSSLPIYSFSNCSKYNFYTHQMKKNQKNTCLYLFMNKKILICFITLLQMIGREGSYVTHLINLFIFKCNYSLKWLFISLEGKKKLRSWVVIPCWPCHY